LWAEQVHISGTEQTQSLATFGRNLVRFRIRYREDVTPQMRVAFKGQFFDISSVHDETGRREFAVITAIQGMTGGQ